MDCETIQSQGIAERYREGTLEPDEAEAYEQHYFECDRCFADLQLGDQLERDLRTHGRRLFAPEIAEQEKGRPDQAARSPSQPGQFRWLHPGWAVGTLVAAASVVAILLATVLRPQDNADALRDLWTPVPYPFVAAELRGQPGDQAFSQAMEFYRAGNYQAAVEELITVRDAAPGDPVVHFYLGVSYLMTGQARTAAAELEQAVTGEASSNVYRWYLAQAYLKAGRRTRAEVQLRQVAETENARSLQARELLEKLAALE